MIIAAAVGSLGLGSLAACGPAGSQEPYRESFDSTGSWTAGEDATAAGTVSDGVYKMTVAESGASFWVTAGRKFADGVFEVEATPLEGTADNGYGMLLRADTKQGSFYVFKVSSDGYVYIGRCAANCAEREALVDRDWFGSDAVAPGFGTANRLRVTAAGAELRFFVNDVEVGRATETTLKAGDIGLLAETFSPGGLEVHFDNFTVTPLGESEAVGNES
jgi:hypothetical protein